MLRSGDRATNRTAHAFTGRKLRRFSVPAMLTLETKGARLDFVEKSEKRRPFNSMIEVRPYRRWRRMDSGIAVLLGALVGGGATDTSGTDHVSFSGVIGDVPQFL